MEPKVICEDLFHHEDVYSEKVLSTIFLMLFIINQIVKRIADILTMSTIIKYLIYNNLILIYK